MNRHDEPEHTDLETSLDGVSPEEADRLRAVWAAVGAEEPIDFPDDGAVEQVWQALDAGARPRRTAARPARAPRLRRIPRWMPALAAAVLVGVVGLGLWLRPVVRTAPPGRQLAVTLPDGSHVILNSGASIRYARRFAPMRAVHLDGEAFFEVVPGEASFVVHTFNARVTVHGTRFNVRAWPGSLERRTTVTLAEGRVALAPANGGEAVIMAPGETRWIARGATEPSPADTLAQAYTLAWRTGDLVFKDQWLGVILEDVERRFAVDIELLAPEMRTRRLNLAFRQPGSAEAVVRDLCTALGLSYRETTRGFELFTPPASI